MFGDLGAPELLIILALVVVLFGAGRIGGLGKDIGTSIKEFRKAMKDDDQKPANTAPAAVEPPQAQPLPPTYVQPQQAPVAPPAAAQAPRPPESRPPSVF